MSILDSYIKRIYRCSRKQCDAVVEYNQKFGEDFMTKCPFCEKSSLLLESADCGISVLMELSKPKTLGTLAEQNGKELEKTEEYHKKQEEKKKKRPFWRKNTDKCDFKVLKNPSKYIETGKA